MRLLTFKQNIIINIKISIKISWIDSDWNINIKEKNKIFIILIKEVNS